MEKQKLKWLTWGVALFMVLAVGVMLSGTLHRSAHITLPPPEDGQSTPGDTPGGSMLTLVEVTPDTVQAAVETLARPAAYRRTVTVEQFWDGGSGSYEVSAAVDGPWTRTDRTMPDGRVRHALTGPERVYIWYNSEKTIYSSPVGAVNADVEQSIPTYEDILALPEESITAADERVVSGLHCIYVETARDEMGYSLRYWVSLDTGLLVMAEKLENDTTVYRMAALTMEEGSGDADSFRLPDGTSVLAE